MLCLFRSCLAYPTPLCPHCHPRLLSTPTTPGSLALSSNAPRSFPLKGPYTAIPSDFHAECPHTRKNSAGVPPSPGSLPHPPLDWVKSLRVVASIFRKWSWQYFLSPVLFQNLATAQESVCPSFEFGRDFAKATMEMCDF